MPMVPMSDGIPCVILAGGKGTRLSEETKEVPKPLLFVGDKPLLHHVIDIYRVQGVKEFIIPVGYLQHLIFNYFAAICTDSFTVVNGVEYIVDGCSVRLVDTGEETQTGGRLKRIKHAIGKRPFHFTYGDGVGNVNIHTLLDAQLGTWNLATITAVHPEGRFGRLVIDEHSQVTQFGEKIEAEQDWVNGGFSILSPRIINGVTGDETNLEKEVYPVIAMYGFMAAVRHAGYWKAVDTLRDLEDLRKTYEERGPVWLML